MKTWHGLSFECDNKTVNNNIYNITMITSVAKVSALSLISASCSSSSVSLPYWSKAMADAKWGKLISLTE